MTYTFQDMVRTRADARIRHDTISNDNISRMMMMYYTITDSRKYMLQLPLVPCIDLTAIGYIAGHYKIRFKNDIITSCIFRDKGNKYNTPEKIKQIIEYIVDKHQNNKYIPTAVTNININILKDSIQQFLADMERELL